MTINSIFKPLILGTLLFVLRCSPESYYEKIAYNFANQFFDKTKDIDSLCVHTENINTSRFFSRIGAKPSDYFAPILQKKYTHWKVVYIHTELIGNKKELSVHIMIYQKKECIGKVNMAFDISPNNILELKPMGFEFL